LEKQKYAKWKASDISNALKAGRTPISGNLHRPKEVPPPDSSSFPTIPIGEKLENSTEELKTVKDEEDIQKEETKQKEKEIEKKEVKEGELIPLTYTQEPYDTMGISAENVDEAHKYARYAVSAMQFEDRTNAIVNLTRALNALGVILPGLTD